MSRKITQKQIDLATFRDLASELDECYENLWLKCGVSFADRIRLSARVDELEAEMKSLAKKSKAVAREYKQYLEESA